MIELRKDKELEQRLLAEYRVISNALDRLGHGYEAVEKSIRKMQEEFPLVVRRELRLNEVDKEIRSIWSMYSTFEQYQDNRDQVIYFKVKS